MRPWASRRYCGPMVSRVCWEGVRVTLERAAYGNLGYMPASGSRIEFPEWSRHMDPAQTPRCPGEWGHAWSLRMCPGDSLLEHHGEWRVRGLVWLVRAG